MGLIKRLVPTELKFTPSSDINWTRIETLIHGPGASDVGNLLRGGDGNSAVFACLMAIATAFPEAPLHVFRREQDGKEKHLEEHPLQQLLNDPTPNGELSIEELWFWTQWAKHTDGNAYWVKVRSGNETTGNVVALWPVSPSLMEPRTAKDDWITHYRRQIGPNEFVNVPVENVIHFRMGIDDRDMRRGLSPLKRLVREISTDEEAEKFTDALLRNYAVPGLVVIPSGGMLDEPTAERISNSLRRKFGTDQRGNIAVLSRDAKVEQFGFSPEQLNLQSLHRLPEERIAAVLRVPPIVAGLGAGLERATYSNFREAREMFTETTLIPMWRADAAKINTSLKQDFASDRNIYCAFDTTDVRALQEDEDKKYARLNIAVQGIRPWITPNEARTDVGLPPIEGGDELVVRPVSEERRPPDMDEEDVESGDEEDVEMEKGRTASPAMRPFSWTGKATRRLAGQDGSDAERDALERKHSGRIAAALRTILREVVPDGTTVETITPSTAVRRYLDNRRILRDAIFAMLTEGSNLGLDTGMTQVEQLLGVAKQANISLVNWDLANQVVLAWVRQHTASLVVSGDFGVTIGAEGMRETMGDLDRHTANVLAAAVGDWVENGLPLRDLINVLSAPRGPFSPARAEMVAVTEVTRSYFEGQRAAWRSSGVVSGMRWQTSNDEKVCSVCAPLGGLVFSDEAQPASQARQRANAATTTLDGEFTHPDGRMFSGPPSHPRCRCWALPVLAGEM